MVVESVAGVAKEMGVFVGANRAGVDIGRAAITIRSGETARLKILHLAGDSAALMGKLERWLGARRQGKDLA